MFKHLLVRNNHEIFGISSYCKARFISSTLAGCISAAISPNPRSTRRLCFRALSPIQTKIAAHSGSRRFERNRARKVHPELQQPSPSRSLRGSTAGCLLSRAAGRRFRDTRARAHAICARAHGHAHARCTSRRCI